MEEKKPPTLIFLPGHARRGKDHSSQRPRSARQSGACDQPTLCYQPSASLIQLTKEYGLLNAAEIGRTGVTRAAERDFYRIESLIRQMIRSHRGSYHKQENLVDLVVRHESGTEYDVRSHKILTGEIEQGPRLFAALETFEKNPGNSYLRVEISEGSRPMKDPAPCAVPSLYPAIARLLKVATKAIMPYGCRYKPLREEGLLRLIDAEGRPL